MMTKLERETVFDDYIYNLTKKYPETKLLPHEESRLKSLIEFYSEKYGRVWIKDNYDNISLCYSNENRVQYVITERTFRFLLDNYVMFTSTAYNVYTYFERIAEITGEYDVLEWERLKDYSSPVTLRKTSFILNNNKTYFSCALLNEETSEIIALYKEREKEK